MNRTLRHWSSRTSGLRNQVGRRYFRMQFQHHAVRDLGDYPSQLVLVNSEVEEDGHLDEGCIYVICGGMHQRTGV